jgi:hypothetical protein
VDTALSEQSCSDLQVPIEQVLSDASERSTIEGENTLPLQGLSALCEIIIYERCDIFRWYEWRKLALVAEDAPVRAPQIRDENGDHYRG